MQMISEHFLKYLNHIQISSETHKDLQKDKKKKEKRKKSILMKCHTTKETLSKSSKKNRPSYEKQIIPQNDQVSQLVPQIRQFLSVQPHLSASPATYNLEPLNQRQGLNSYFHKFSSALGSSENMSAFGVRELLF